MLAHPLVSPVMQPTLGGLPPLLIMVGGGEILRDEQIYLAHKCANPSKYLPPDIVLNDKARAAIKQFSPTDVQLQVWDDLCHVAPTLSFTRPAKYMYRSVAQFGVWALARAQQTEIDILDDDDVSFVSTDSNSSAEQDKAGSKGPDKSTEHPSSRNGSTSENRDQASGRVGRAGDPIPPFENHMIRQRIDRHGRIYPLAAKEDLPALNMPSIEVGVPQKGPVGKWMKAQSKWNTKFAKQKVKIQKQRISVLLLLFQEHLLIKLV